MKSLILFFGVLVSLMALYQPSKHHKPSKVVRCAQKCVVIDNVR